MSYKNLLLIILAVGVSGCANKQQAAICPFDLHQNKYGYPEWFIGEYESDLKACDSDIRYTKPTEHVMGGEVVHYYELQDRYALGDRRVMITVVNGKVEGWDTY